MADSPIGDGAMPTPQQAAQIAARFLVHTPHRPRPMTTREADQAQQLIEATKRDADPTLLMYGHWLERLLEAAMAVSHELFKREAQVNTMTTELVRARQLPAAVQERLEQGLLLARFAQWYVDHGEDLELPLEQLRIPREDLLGAVHDSLGPSLPETPG